MVTVGPHEPARRWPAGQRVVQSRQTPVAGACAWREAVVIWYGLPALIVGAFVVGALVVGVFVVGAFVVAPIE